jgi:(2Fe-2S) ferredoxin
VTDGGASRRDGPVVPFELHVFVCVNRRPDGSPRGCCASRGSETLREALKAATKRPDLRGRVRVNGAACLDFCEFGPTVCVYPENTWYGGVGPNDVAEIVESHLSRGVPVDRLRLPESALRRDGKSASPPPPSAG